MAERGIMGPRITFFSRGREEIKKQQDVSNTAKPTKKHVHSCKTKDKKMKSSFKPSSTNVVTPARGFTANDISDDKDLGDIHQGKSINDLTSSNQKKKISSQDYGFRVLQIYKEIASHRQEDMPVQHYFGILNELWESLAFLKTDLAQTSKGCEFENLTELTERDKVMQFLTGLNDSYINISGKILLRKPFPTVKSAYYAIILEGKRRRLADALMQSKLQLKNQINGRSNNGDTSLGIDQDDYEDDFDYLL